VRLKHLAVLLAATALIASPAYAASAGSASDPTQTGPARSTTLSEPTAESLLAQAEAAFAETGDTEGDTEGDPSARLSPGDGDDTDLTLLLRDLAARRGELSPADRKVADALLARPTGGLTPQGVKYRTKSRHKCYRHVCIHWVTKGEDKPPLADGPDRDRLPEWVETNGRTAERVWRREVTRGGYRAPRSDLGSPNHGPNRKLDIYLANIGDSSLFGFCTSDDPSLRRSRAVSAYCVIDDDFSRREFGARPANMMAVTIAHEFFHAVQYAYDWREDAWLLEGSAAWIEDQLYDSVNDNRNYLANNSPLSAPRIPLDAFDLADSGNQAASRYGVWTFFQYLGETYPATYGGLPAIVRDIFGQADNSSAARPRQYSTQAVNTVLAAKHGSSFADAFADFSARNLHPAAFYSEGSAWPSAKPELDCPASCSRNWALDHMSSRSARIRPSATSSNLSVSVTTPAALPGAKATLTVKLTSGEVLDPLPVDVNGAPVTHGFTGSTVEYAVVTLTNGNTQFQCGQRTSLSCHGIPLHDGAAMQFTASVS
jgi:hypothetical protein